MDRTINWIRLGKEIAQTTNGFAVLRLLEAHGVTHFSKYNKDEAGVKQSCTIEMVIDYGHKER